MKPKAVLVAMTEKRVMIFEQILHELEVDVPPKPPFGTGTVEWIEHALDAIGEILG